jgi:hypothetical protein
VGLSGGIEFMLVSSGDDVCKLSQDQNAAPINGGGYYCYDSSASNDYPDRNDRVGTQNKAIVQDSKTDKVAGGGAFGNVRLLLTVDYAITSFLMAGIRGGIVLNAYPGAAASNDGKSPSIPLHVEGRVTGFFVKDALAKTGVAPYAMAAVGYGQTNAKVSVSVREQGQPGNKNVDAWAIGGPMFASIGGGIRYALTPKFAFLGGPRVNFAFGNGLGFFPSAGIEAGAQFGF